MYGMVSHLFTSLNYSTEEHAEYYFHYLNNSDFELPNSNLFDIVDTL